MRNKTVVFELPEDLEWYENVSSPERTLLTAVLERAVRDLEEHVTYEDRKDAISWVLNRSRVDRQRNLWFTFKQCIQDLDLSECQVNFILEKVEHAKVLQKEIKDARKLEAEREEDRVGDSSLAKKPGDILCAEISTIPRDGIGRLGCYCEDGIAEVSPRGERQEGEIHIQLFTERLVGSAGE